MTLETSRGYILTRTSDGAPEIWRWPRSRILTVFGADARHGNFHRMRIGGRLLAMAGELMRSLVYH